MAALGCALPTSVSTIANTNAAVCKIRMGTSREATANQHGDTSCNPADPASIPMIPQHPRRQLESLELPRLSGGEASRCCIGPRSPNGMGLHQIEGTA